MKTLYLDCSMGCAGDMLTGALLELFPNREEILTQLNNLGIPHVKFLAEESMKCGIAGTHIRVLVAGEEEDDHHHHHHSGMDDIAHIVSHLHLTERVREQILEVYNLIAQAESQVHRTPVSQIHFHEVGALDAVADITAVCYLMDRLNVHQVMASPVHVGSGQVKCAHGLLPVPAPATALILQGVPIYGGQIQGELCTPTGGALLKYYVNHFGNMPPMATAAIGYGMGKKDFDAPNCVRAMLGDTPDQADDVLELSCNLDDMTGEDIGFAMEILLEAGALDVFTTPIGMKKNRPGVLFTVLCRAEDRETLLPLMFRHTSTLGVRENRLRRYTLSRRSEVVDTPYGPVRQKVSTGYSVERRKYEYEDLASIAREHQLSLRDIK